jgi:phosphate transport system substrate-binding protein
MQASGRGPTRVLRRIALYLVVIAVVFLVRALGEGRGLGFRFPTESDSVTTITLAGRDLAPTLIPELVEGYRRDFPHLHVLLEDGGTARAIEAMANRQAAVGLLYRPPLASEQRAVREAVRDTVEYYPIALGGIALLVNPASRLDSLTMDEVRAMARGDRSPLAGRMYVPDPNQGLWSAFRAAAGVQPGTPEPDSVVFLKDEGAVVQAVAADPEGIGIASTLNLPAQGAAAYRALLVTPDGGKAAVPPDYERIGYGEYPLFHYLYVACLPNGSLRGAMFVAHLTSDRGQRQIERAGFLPARIPLREIHLTRDPIPSPSQP